MMYYFVHENIFERPRNEKLEIQVLVWDRCKNVAGIKELMGSQPSPLDNWNTNSNTYVNK
jgi:hypothetical protein